MTLLVAVGPTFWLFTASPERSREQAWHRTTITGWTTHCFLIALLWKEMKRLVYACGGALSLFGTGCQTAPAQPLRAKTAADCEKAQTCAVAGQLEMSSDGHGYIGILRLNDGSCINVSLPEIRSKQLFGQVPKATDLVGRVLSFPYAEGAMSFTVSGREIGYGKCAPYFLFVR